MKTTILSIKKIEKIVAGCFPFLYDERGFIEAQTVKIKPFRGTRTFKNILISYSNPNILEGKRRLLSGLLHSYRISMSHKLRLDSELCSQTTARQGIRLSLQSCKTFWTGDRHHGQSGEAKFGMTKDQLFRSFILKKKAKDLGFTPSLASNM